MFLVPEGFARGIAFAFRDGDSLLFRLKAHSFRSVFGGGGGVNYLDESISEKTIMLIETKLVLCRCYTYM